VGVRELQNLDRLERVRYRLRRSVETVDRSRSDAVLRKISGKHCDVSSIAADKTVGASAANENVVSVLPIERIVGRARCRAAGDDVIELRAYDSADAPIDRICADGGIPTGKARLVEAIELLGIWAGRREVHSHTSSGIAVADTGQPVADDGVVAAR